MKDRSKLIAAVLAVICLAGTCVVWTVANNSSEKINITCSVTEVGKYGGVWLDLTDSQMERLGVTYGTDLYVEFKDRTYKAFYCINYTGAPTFSIFLSYVTTDEKYSIGIFNGILTEYVDIGVGDTVKISVAGPNKYYPNLTHYIQDISDDRSDFPSDQAFANYRPMNGGDIDVDTIYRSCVPWYQGERGKVADDYYASVGVDWLICLDGDDDAVAEVAEQYPDYYASGLYRQDRIHAKMMSPAVQSHPEEIRWFIDSVLDTDGEIGIFCTLGKDRTGIYCIILQALAGASLEEAEYEFMLSMKNYYGIEKGTAEYDAVYEIYLFRVMYLFQNPDAMSELLDIDWDNVKLDDFVLEDLITKYLIDEVGITQDKIDALKARITA